MNTGAPQGCVLGPILYTLYTHDCAASHENTTILKFADDTTVLGLISNHDGSAYRREVEDLVLWCQNNNLTLNVNKTKEVIVNLRKRRSQHTPLHIGETEVERVDTFKFLSVHISEDFTWTHHIPQMIRKGLLLSFLLLFLAHLNHLIFLSCYLSLIPFICDDKLKFTVCICI